MYIKDVYDFKFFICIFLINSIIWSYLLYFEFDTEDILLIIYSIYTF